MMQCGADFTISGTTENQLFFWGTRALENNKASIPLRRSTSTEDKDIIELLGWVYLSVNFHCKQILLNYVFSI